MSFVSQLPVSSLHNLALSSSLGWVAFLIAFGALVGMQRSRIASFAKTLKDRLRKRTPPSQAPFYLEDVKQRMRDLRVAHRRLFGSSGFLKPRSRPDSVLFLGCLSQSHALLQSSTLDFPYQSHFDPKAPETEQPMLHWAMQERFLGVCVAPPPEPELDEQSWSTLLRATLGKRVRQELRYLVVSLDLGSIAHSSLAERKQLGQQLGRRIQALNAQLKRQIPVFLTLDGLEQLPGFSPFMRGITKAQWSHPWGVQGFYDDCSHLQMQNFAEQQRLFEQKLHDRVLQDMLDQADPALGASHQHFAQAFSDLGPSLLDLLRSLLSCGTKREPLHLAGVYFTSLHTQQTLDQSSDTAADAGLFASSLIPHMNRQCRVVEEQKPWVQRSTRKLHTRKLLRTTALVATASALWGMVLSSSRNNQAIQRDFNELLNEVPSYSSEPLPTLVWKQSAEFDQRLDTLSHHNPWSHRWGMSQLDVLHKGSRSLFLRLTLQAGIAPLRAQDRAWLAHQVQQDSPLRLQELTEMQERLFRYLMLSAAGESQLRNRDCKNRMIKSLKEHWVHSKTINDSNTAQLIATKYVALQEILPELRFPADAALVQRVQARLLREEPMTRWVDHAITRAGQARPRLGLDRVVSPQLISSQRLGVSAAFTQEGWEQELRPRLEVILKEQNELAWILGGTPQQIHQRQQSNLTRIQSHYRQAFTVAWHELLDSVELHPQADLLKLAHPSQSPFHQLSTALHTHTQLTPLTNSLGGSQAQPAPWAPSLAEPFAPLIDFAPKPAKAPVDAPSSGHARYQPLLAKLQEMGPAPLGEPPSVLRAQLRSLVRKSHELAMEQRIDWRPWFARLLSTPFRLRLQSNQAKLDEDLSANWCALSQRLDQEVFSRYPFSKHARQEVELSALRQLLHPEQGELWRFVNDKLSARVARQGRHFVSAQGLPAKRQTPRRLLRFLSAAWTLSQTLYPPGQDQLHLTLSVQAQPQVNIRRIALNLDHQRYHYVKGPRRSGLLEWPSQATVPRSELLAQTEHGELRIQKRGTWSLLRILDCGQTRRLPHSQAFLGTWPLPHAPNQVITLLFRPIQGSPILFTSPNQSLLGLFRARPLRRTPRLFHSSFTCT